MKISVHQPQYIPWIGYFDKIDRSDCFVFLDNVQYKAREFQNRNKIHTKDRSIWLTVPVVTKGLGRQIIKDVRIDNNFDWRRQHWNSLQSWYGQAEHFKQYCDFFKDVYSKTWQSLLDLNVYIIKFILDEFDIKTKIYNESDLNINSTSTDRIVDICKELKADSYLSGIGGKSYLDEKKFDIAGIELEYQEFNHPVYNQLYAKDNEFMPYMSCIDLLFNCGKMGITIVREKRRTT